MANNSENINYSDNTGNEERDVANIDKVKDLKVKDFKLGETAEILGFERGNKSYREKLLSMGLTKGVVIKFLKFAPFGDPVEIELRGFKLSLRKEEAKILILRRIL